jgi:hypothetical protein
LTSSNNFLSENTKLKFETVIIRFPFLLIFF